MAKTKQKTDEAPKTFRPSDLATELDVDAKLVRSYLRREFPRPLESKNSSWFLTEDQAQAVREHFTPTSDEDDEA